MGGISAAYLRMQSHEQKCIGQRSAPSVTVSHSGGDVLAVCTFVLQSRQSQ